MSDSAQGDRAAAIKDPKFENHRDETKDGLGNIGLKHAYAPIEDHALIGNLRTAALISLHGVIDSFCFPYFDSPSVFASILDSQKGGHWGITPLEHTIPKQTYLPNSAVLITKFLAEDGVATLTDCMPRPSPTRPKPLLPWVIRKVEGIRGATKMRLELFPAFDYARQPHTLTLVPAGRSNNGTIGTKAVFKSKILNLELLIQADSNDGLGPPVVELKIDDTTYPEHLGPGIVSEFEVREDQIVTFILRECDPKDELSAKASELTKSFCEGLLADTLEYWANWIHKAKYQGRWREFIHRSAFTLKMLIFEPTGAIVAAPTFSLPEAIGGGRNWDYRYTWIRDSSFTVYAMIRLGFTEEARAYMEFMQARMSERKPNEPLQIVYTIHGGKDMVEEELLHLEGYKGSRPVRIGNGAADHVQLDVYGELMDSIYLFQKYSRPCSWDLWLGVRSLVDYVCDNWDQPDMSIWEVRSRKQNYTYSKVMLWVAVDRGLRLSEKRSLPCPNRARWLATRDRIHEEIMTMGWNDDKQFFCQSYESREVLDSALLIMPLVFFISPSDPRFISTLRQILRTPEKGGLTANNLTFRYDVSKAEDGVGGEEGAFTMCTLWAIEALTRAGAYEPELLKRARRMFEDLITYGNHVMLYAEEISRSGEGLGNFPQAFTHVSAISSAYNLNKIIEGGKASLH